MFFVMLSKIGIVLRVLKILFGFIVLLIVCFILYFRGM